MHPKKIRYGDPPPLPGVLNRDGASPASGKLRAPHPDQTDGAAASWRAPSLAAGALSLGTRAPLPAEERIHLSDRHTGQKVVNDSSGSPAGERTHWLESQ